METSEADPRQAMYDALTRLRAHISGGRLVLFVGEQLSVLPQPARLDHWWGVQNGMSGIAQLESEFMANLPQRPAKVHNVLRTLGTFPLILTTNQDELLERLLWGRGSLGSTLGEKIRLYQVGQVMADWPDLRRHLIVKLYGDTSYTARFTTESRQFLEGILRGEHDHDVTAVEFLHKVFRERPVLFLGCDLQHTIYQRLLARFVKNTPVDHYTFESSETRNFSRDGSLVTLQANLELWEFVQYLSTGTIEQHIQPGQTWDAIDFLQLSIHCSRSHVSYLHNMTSQQRWIADSLAKIGADQRKAWVYEKSYLGTQREEYLLQQLALEKQASEIVFHTSSITNALATDEALEYISKPALEEIYSSDPFGVFTDEHVKRSLDAMKARRDNLVAKIKEGTKVVTMFFYHGLQAELDPTRVTDPKKRQMAIKKYVEVIKLCQTFVTSKSSLEIRIVDWKNKAERKEMDKEKFGLARLKGGEDEAIFHGHPATAGKKAFAVQLIAVNGEETARKRKIYEKSRERSWSPEDSVRRLLQEVLSANRELVDKHGEDMSAIKKEDLEMLQSMSEIHLLTNKKLDQCSNLLKIGSGSFSTVYTAMRQGRTVAVKILNEVQSTRDLRAFQDEFKLLRDMKHTSIVQVEDCIVQDNRLGIIMEYMAGGNLRDHLRHSGTQDKDFVLRFAKQIGQALEYLHQRDVMHRDVKPENVFISEDHSTFKLGDFGLARVTEGTRQTKTLIGSYRYMAPEVMSSRGHYSKKADVYSYALCLIELICGEMVFSKIAKHKDAMDEKLRGGLPDIPANCDDYGQRMRPTIERCLKPEAQRPSMTKVLKMLFGAAPVKTDSGQPELLCVGTGSAATAAFEGDPSSSVMVMFNGAPVMLINAGLGVIRSCQELLGQLPNLVLVSSRHSDHAGELATLVNQKLVRRGEQQAADAQLTIVCPNNLQPALQQRVQDDYCDDMASQVTWISAEADETSKFNSSVGKLGVRMLTYSSKEAGFELYYGDNPVLRYLVYRDTDHVNLSATNTGVVTVVEADIVLTNTEQVGDNVYMIGPCVKSENLREQAQNVRFLESGETVSLLVSTPNCDNTAAPGGTAVASGKPTSKHAGLSSTGDAPREAKPKTSAQEQPPPAEAITSENNPSDIEEYPKVVKVAEEDIVERGGRPEDGDAASYLLASTSPQDGGYTDNDKDQSGSVYPSVEDAVSS